MIPEPFSLEEKTPALCFSGVDPDREHPIEMNRIHTILHPKCFSHFIRGLGFDSPDERLSVPEFSFFTGGQPRGDRFHPPKLEEEDYLRLKRHREELARRRKVFLSRMLHIYVDGNERACFDPRRAASVRLDIGPEADVIEVRGEDHQGELVLATLLVRCHQIPPGEFFKDWVVVEGGHKVTIQLTPIWDADGDLEGAQVEVRYAETQPLRAISWLAQRAWFGSAERVKRGRETLSPVRPSWSLVAKAGVAVALAIVAVTAIWYQLQPSPEFPSPPRAQAPPPPEITPESPTPPSTPPARPPAPKEPPVLIAQANWNPNPEAVLRAMRIEQTRSEVAQVDRSSRQTTLLISLPVHSDEGRIYSRYRVTLVVAGKEIWQPSFQAPPVGEDKRRRVLEVVLFPQRLPEANSYELRVEGRTPSGWQPLGHVLLNPLNRKD